MDSLVPGAPLDLRGTEINDDLLTRILTATGGRLGRARFDRARFTGPARFGRTVFTGDASFGRARFDALASFFCARFASNVSFRDARFARQLSMHGAGVRGHACFDGASVGEDALYSEARFARTVSFERARFHGFASFDRTGFDGDATFRGARFGRAVSFGGTSFAGGSAFQGVRFAADAFLSPASIGRRLDLTGVSAQDVLTIDAGTCTLDLGRARVMDRLTVRLAGGQVDLRGVTVHGHATVSNTTVAARDEAGRGEAGRTLRIVSLDDVQADRLTLVGADLSGCRLSRVGRPERLRLSDCGFASPPAGLQVGLRWPPVRWWSRRQLLADEQVWRGWSADGTDRTDPGGLALLYSRLRGGLDDERTAADFAFGAMEMRRLAATTAGRLLLGAYWLACGYGMRMGRALAWFALLAAITVGALVWWGTPQPPRRPISHRSVIPAQILPTKQG
ncbi:MAG TPA: pentapeptide repeat-containing protein [Thermopolyspora sp.]